MWYTIFRQKLTDTYWNWLQCTNRHHVKTHLLLTQQKKRKTEKHKYWLLWVPQSDNKWFLKQKQNNETIQNVLKQTSIEKSMFQVTMQITVPQITENCGMLG